MIDVRAVVAERAEEREQRADDRASGSRAPGSPRRTLARARYRSVSQRREAEHLDFLRRLVARADVAEVVQLAPLRRPAEEQRVRSDAKCVSPRKLGSDRDDEQQEQPRAVGDERRASVTSVSASLRHREQLREQRRCAGRLPPRALEVIVELGILELREIERRGVLHEPHAHAFEKRSPSRLSTSADARAEDSPTTTIASSSATSSQSVPRRTARRASEITSSMMSFPTQSVATGTNARDKRSTTSATVSARCGLPDEAEQRRHGTASPRTARASRLSGVPLREAIGAAVNYQ